MRQIAFAALVLCMAALEGTLPGVLLLEWMRPLLVVPLVFFFALRLNTAEGALLSLLAGLAQESVSGFPAGRSAFTLVLLFVLARLVLSSVRIDGRIFEIFFCGVLAVAFHVVTLLLANTFELARPLQEELSLGAVLLGAAGATMFAAVPVLALAHRVDRIGVRPRELL